MTKSAYKRIIDIVITVLTAIAATLGTTSCMGYHTPLTAMLGL